MNLTAALILLFSFTSFADTGSDLVNLIKVHKSIIHQCIEKSEWDDQVNIEELREKFGEDADELYILNFKIYEVTAHVEVDHHYGEYECTEMFPYLAWVYYYDGIDHMENLRDEVKRVKQIQAELFQ